MDAQPVRKQVGRWRRFVMRLKERALWAARGVLLWVLQKPFLRWLPLPYPATASVEKWITQCKSQVQGKAFPARHFQKALAQNLFTMANLGECVHLRNRLGLQTAFCEDPMLDGMLEGMALKGLSKRLKNAAQAEALEAAQKAGSSAKREQEARTLIGPKGGLPTLRRDLLKLAALLHVEVDEKDTVDNIKTKVRPMVEILKSKPQPPVAVKSAAKPKGAIPKSAARDASASSMSAESRPLTQITDRQAEMWDQMQRMAQELQQLRDMVPSGAVPISVDLTAMDVKSEPMEMELTEEEMRHAQEACAEERLARKYGTSDRQQLEMEGIEISDDD